jgi:hypothetical protein
MKKQVLFAIATMTLASCSSDGLVNNSSSGGGEAPIAFSVEKRNITRTGETPTTTPKNLEATGHYNFGVWAYKLKGADSQLVMDNYLVGYSDGNGIGYANKGASTWSNKEGVTTDHKDHKSPWFYENLGTDEYDNTDKTKGYVKTASEFMSANKNQYLRYWDLAYTNTNFYAYAPYRSENVSFDYDKKEITVKAAAQTAGYDDPSLQEFMYAGAQATNKNLEDVQLQFKHLGAQVNLRFYESVRGYRVEIIDVIGNDANGDPTGIQATPATVTESGTPATKTYTKKPYYISCGATIDYSTITSPSATVNFPTDAQTTEDNLKFAIPVKDNNGNNLKVYKTKYNVIPEVAGTGVTQTYAVSPTVYYPVAQPEESEVGFTFHVSYKLIAEDNGEEITVKDARVYVPAYVKNGDNKDYIAAWQPNTKYTYTFKITESSTGSTSPTNPDITTPSVPTTPQVYPIVFDGAKIEDYSEKYPVSEVSGENTNY